MGYTTELKGRFEFNKKLDPTHQHYLEMFAATRRMKRDPIKLIATPDKHALAAGLDVGTEGEYFVAGTGDFGQGHEESVVDHNHPPRTQPGLWCQWIPTEDGKYLEWDGGEKFYEYVKWLEYIIDNFLTRWGYSITGIVRWQGEDMSDRGKIIVKDNKIEIVNLE